MRLTRENKHHRKIKWACGNYCRNLTVGLVGNLVFRETAKGRKREESRQVGKNKPGVIERR